MLTFLGMLMQCAANMPHVGLVVVLHFCDQAKLLDYILLTVHLKIKSVKYSVEKKKFEALCMFTLLSVMQ